MHYKIVEYNINVDNDSRKNKAKRKWSIYRDGKSKPHRTKKGKGVVGRLIEKKGS